MKTDHLSEKKISLGKCVIKATDTPGIYRIDDVATVAAMDAGTIVTGDYSFEADQTPVNLDDSLLGREVALIKEVVMGTAITYKIKRLSTVRLPSFMLGNGQTLLNNLV